MWGKKKAKTGRFILIVRKVRGVYEFVKAFCFQSLEHSSDLRKEGRGSERSGREGKGGTTSPRVNET